MVQSQANMLWGPLLQASPETNFGTILKAGVALVQVGWQVALVVAAIGMMLYLIAYYSQGLAPDWFQQYRNFIRNGLVLTLAVLLVVGVLSTLIQLPGGETVNFFGPIQWNWLTFGA